MQRHQALILASAFLLILQLKMYVDFAKRFFDFSKMSI